MTTTTATVQVSSEIGRLRKVIVHRPDEGIARISPKRAEELLFDDIVYLPRMQEEHEVFTRVLKAFLGDENVLEIEDLLQETLDNDPNGKMEMIDRIIDFEELPRGYKLLLSNLPNAELAQVLISGYLARDDHYLFDPIPNFVFTRDIAVTINDHVIITKAAKSARHRENLLTQMIFSSHPIFKRLHRQGKVINLNHTELFPPSKKGEAVSIEGGDVMVISGECLLVGCSERSTVHGAHSLRDVLFEHEVINKVALISIPSERYCMHIDTLFTQIDAHHLVAYGPIVVDGLSSQVEVYSKQGEKATYYSVEDFWRAEIDPNVKLILSGGGEHPYQEREQWTDGCNLVALKPGVALTYDRNPYTENAFREAGYRIIHAYDLLAQFERGELSPEAVESTIITLPSNELSRARGGSHCMTCPIDREPLA